MTGEISPRVAGSVVSYRFGGREYSGVTVSSCHTCNSPFRFEIEEAIVAGRVWTKIEQMTIALGGDERRVSVQSMKNHYRGNADSPSHMPMELTQTRAIVEARATRVGKRVLDDAASLVDGMTLMETVVQKTFEAIASGREQPGVRDGLRAAKMLADLGEYDGGSVDQQAYVEAFMVYQEEAEKIMGKEAFNAFGEALATNPVLAALAARYEGKSLDDGDVVQSTATEVPAEG